MSALPLSVRYRFALREADDIARRFAEGAEADEAFDAGEFSGPASCRAEAHAQLANVVRLRVQQRLIDLALDEYLQWAGGNLPRDWYENEEWQRDAATRRDWGDDPMGAWHGRNE